jgi:hypothetical protein
VAALSLLTLLWLEAPASATTWWISGPEQQAELQQALDEIWPEAPVRLRVGEPLEPRDDVWIEGDVLFAARGEARWSRPVPPDPWLQVALARAWLRPAVEAPPPLPPPPPSAPAPEPPPVRPASVVFTTLEAGAGQRLPQGNPSVRIAAATGLSRGPLAFSIRAEAETGRGERASAPYGEGEQDALDATRAGMLLGLEGSASPLPDLALGLEARLGTRIVYTTVPLYTESAGLQIGPSLSAAATARRRGPGPIQPICSLSLSWDPLPQTLRSLETDQGPQDPAVQPLAAFFDVGFRVSR